jgi:hypothetical protein
MELRSVPFKHALDGTAGCGERSRDPTRRRYSMPTQCTASEAINTGDAVCLTGWDAEPVPQRPIVARATATKLASSKTVFGVAQTDSTPGPLFVLVAGEVAQQSITGLSTGAGTTSRLVVTNGDSLHEARLRYIYNVTGHELDTSPVCDAVPERFVVGTSDENGNLAIQPRHNSDETGYPKAFNLLAYGAAENWDASKKAPTDNGTANLAAFNRALAAMRAEGNIGAKLVANGRFYFSDTLVLNQTIVFEGTSMNEPTVDSPDAVNPNPLRRSSPGTWLIFPATNAAKRVTGIRLHSAGLRDVDSPPGLGGSGADKTILRNLTIHCYLENNMMPQGADATSPDWDGNGEGHGVHASTTFYAENVTVEFFAGDGFHLIGYYSSPNPHPDDPDSYVGGNLDNSRISACTVGGCGRDGYHIYGVDATSCLFDGCSAVVNRRYGFFDSTRENTYISCHAEGNGAVALGPAFPAADGAIGGEYRTEGGSSTFIGCYAEGNGDRCFFDGDVTVIGGAIGNSNTAKDSTVFLLEHGVASRAPVAYFNDRGRRGQFAIHPPPDWKTVDAESSLVARFSVGSQNGNAVEAFHWSVTDWDPARIPLQPASPAKPIAWDPPVVNDYSTLLYTDDPASDAYRWWTLQNISYYRSVMRFPTIGSQARYPAPWFTNGFFIGNANDPVGRNPAAMHFTAAATVTGQAPAIQFDGSPQTHELADVVWNNRPAPGGALGQVCIASGTQGSPRNIGTTSSLAITAGDTSLTLDNETSFAVGQYFTIAGLDGVFQITMPLAGRLVTFTPTAPMPGAPKGAAINVVTVAQTTAGNQNVIVDTTVGLLVGQYITISGIIAPRIRGITAIVDATTIQIDGGDPGTTGPLAVLTFNEATFATFGSVRGTVTVDVTGLGPTIALDGSYETIKLTGNLGADTTVTVPSEDGWSARFLDLTVRAGSALQVRAGTLPGTICALLNGQTQRLYLEYDPDGGVGGTYNLRPEGPAF